MEFVRKWFPSPATYDSGRLFSLDLLRGLDMFLLTVIGPLVIAAQTGWKCFPEPFYRQFHHAWEDFVVAALSVLELIGVLVIWRRLRDIGK